MTNAIHITHYSRNVVLVWGPAVKLEPTCGGNPDPGTPHVPLTGVQYFHIYQFFRTESRRDLLF